MESLSMTQLAALTISDRIATIAMQRPESRNALSIELLGALRTQVDLVARRDDVSVVVLEGAGKAFCAGMDLKAVLDDPAAPRRLLNALAELTLALRALPAVTVAKVRGAAIGGGCGLACVCDLALTHADSKMGYPEVDLGVCPAVVAPWLVKKIGAGRARRVLLLGGVMSGREAHALGMVDTLVEAEGELDSACDELCARLAKGGAHAIRATKEILNTIDQSTDGALVRRGADLSADVVATPQTQQMLRAKMGM
jgi:methylglutaconyl-CoA hydratase